MKRFLGGAAALILVSAQAFAADMPAKAPILKAPAPVFDWTGFYVGGYVGVGVQQSRGENPTGAAAGGLDYTGSGFLSGGTLGYNWQFGRNWVAGIEGDIGYLGLSHNVQDWNDTFSYNSKTSWLGTLRGRLGYSNGPTLSYVTGGGAFVHATDSLTSFAGSTVESSKTLGGYTYGTGVETMLGGNWTAKAEFLRVNVGKGDGISIPLSIFDVQTDHRYSLMKFGVNYLFGGKPQSPLPSHNWTGFYAGIVGGTGVAQASATQPGAPGVIGENGSGFTAGGLAGYNWQFAPHFVAGVEGDFSWLGVDRSQGQYNDFQGGRNAMLGMKTNWLATLRGRVGYSTGPALLYVTGGGAWVNVRDDWQGANAAAGPAVSSTKTLSGFTAGGGIETTLFGNWTSRTEYLYVDVGSGDTLASTASMVVDHKFHLFRSALVYHIGQ
jgi:outer membrane immunogenic protein